MNSSSVENLVNLAGYNLVNLTVVLGSSTITAERVPAFLLDSILLGFNPPKPNKKSIFTGLVCKILVHIVLTIQPGRLAEQYHEVVVRRACYRQISNITSTEYSTRSFEQTQLDC